MPFAGFVSNIKESINLNCRRVTRNAMCALCKGNKTEGWERCCQLKLTKGKQNVFPTIQLLFSVFWGAPGTLSSSSAIYLNVLQLWAAPDFPSYNIVHQRFKHKDFLSVKTWCSTQNLLCLVWIGDVLCNPLHVPGTLPCFIALLWFLLQGHKPPVSSHLFPFSHHNLFLALDSV